MANPGPLTRPELTDSEALLKQAALEYDGSAKPAFVDVVLTGKRNGVGGKEYALQLRPVPAFMLFARTLPDVRAPKAAAFIQRIKSQNFGVLGEGDDGWPTGTAVLDGVGFPELHTLLTGGSLNKRCELRRISMPARAVAEGIHGKHLPSSYPAWVTKKLSAAGDAALWVYDGKAGVSEEEKPVVHALGMSYDTSRLCQGIPTAVAVDDHAAMAIQAFTWCNVLRECLALHSLKPNIVKFRLAPISVDKYAGPLAEAMPRMTWEALYAGVRLLPDVEQEVLLALLDSNVTFEMCLPTEEEHIKYNNACQEFLRRVEALPAEGPAKGKEPAAAASDPALSSLRDYQRSRRSFASPPCRPKAWHRLCPCCKRRRRPAQPFVPSQV